jgi:hypothetical protein
MDGRRTDGDVDVTPWSNVLDSIATKANNQMGGN